MAEDQNARFRARPGQEIPGESFGEAFKRHKAAGRANFSWHGQTYSTETQEERTQKAYSDTSRRQEGAAAKASNRPGRVRPDETAVSSMDLRDIPGLIARGMSEGVDRAPAGRGLGAAFTAAGAARGAGAAIGEALARRQAANAATATERLASRIDPMLATGRIPETGRFRASEAPLRRAREEAVEEMAREPGFKKGGKVKAYAKGGSVKGAGCEQRGLRKCKVY